MPELFNNNIYSLFSEMADKNRHKTALICLGEKYSYFELKEMVLKFADSLHKLGVGQGSKAIIYLYNLPQTIIAWLALQRLKALPISIAPVYTSHDIKYLANDSGAETIITMDTNVNYVTEILPDTPLKKVVVTNMFDLVSWWKRIVDLIFNKVPRGRLPRGDEFFHFKNLLKNGDVSDLPAFEKDDEESLALILYTGGTTGFPKGVPISQSLFLYRAREWRRAKEGVIPLGEDITLLSAPLYHIIGQSDMASSLLIGGETLVVMPKVNLDASFDHIQRYKIKSMFGVPALYRMMLEHDRLEYYDLSSLKYCGAGGDVLPLEVARRWHKKFNVPMYQGYGATETAGIVSICYSEDGVPPEGSVGKINPGIEYKLVEPGTLEPVVPGESGELLVTSSHAVTEYINKPEETVECFLNLEGKTWYRTKDIVKVDENNWVYFEDRAGDMIKHKGYRVAAAEVERILEEHPAVISSSVVGIPDEKVGERIKAFVVLKEDIKGVSSYDLQKWCRDRLPSYKVPAYIEYRDMLPKSKVGKFLRRELREEERKKVQGN
jgi:long-chain acyl-CoA synthetase